MVLVHPIVGPTKSDDFSAKVRKETYQSVQSFLSNVSFEYLPYNMMVGGPRYIFQVDDLAIYLFDYLM